MTNLHVGDAARRQIDSRSVEAGVDGLAASLVMISAPKVCSPRRDRRGALLLLVLSMLTLFLMIGTLMLVLATRARTTARAFAEVVSDGGLANLAARDLLDEALMVLLRGRQPLPAAAAPPRESLLGDRYGGTTLQRGVDALQTPGTPPPPDYPPDNPPPQRPGTLVATFNTWPDPIPSDLRGSILTIKPKPSDPAPIQSFRVLDWKRPQNNPIKLFLVLANLRTAEPFRTPPTQFPCDVFVNGREFGGEPWDAANDALNNPWLQQPPNPAPVDNDGDGTADGTWLTDILPPQRAGRTARFSFLVRDLDGCLNVNAHGSANAAPGVGPASIDGSKVFTDPTVWPGLLSGMTSPASLLPPTASQPPLTPEQRRAPPGLGGAVNSRFGGGAADAYALRLDFDGSRFSSLRSPIGNVFTLGELERVLRQFDADAGSLSPRLAAILGNSAQAARLLVTTDSWDTCGVVGALVNDIASAANAAALPAEVKEGLRCNLGDRDLTDPTAKQKLFEDLLAVIVAAGAPDDAITDQWAANVVDFIDADTTAGSYQNPDGGSLSGVEPSTLPATFRDALPVKDPGSFESQALLLAVPTGTKSQIETAVGPLAPPVPIVSLAVTYPKILDAFTVASPFQSTVFVTAGGRKLCRWREPGRINVNTCDDKVWNALTGDDFANPFAGGPTPAPARSTADLLLRVPQVFTGPDRDVRGLDRGLANRLANIATCRSNVFAVWITLELVDPEIRGGSPSLHRLFAIVDRSVPVGFSLGQDLNARDAVRVLRYLE